MKKISFILPILLLYHLNIYSLENTIELNWINLATLYKERYDTRSSNRLDKLIAEKTANSGNLWRLDPKLIANYNKTTLDSPSTSGSVTLSQTFPTGTSLSFNSSQTMFNDNVNANTFWNRQNNLSQSYTQSSNFTVAQSLLKGSFLYGLPDVAINTYQEEQSYIISDQNFAKNFKQAYMDYIAVLNNFLLLKQAKMSVERAKLALAEINDSIQQGFKAKSDVYSFEINLHTNQMVLDNSQAQYENSFKKLNYDFFQAEGDPSLVVPTEINYEPIISYLKEKIHKNASYEERISKKQYELDKAKSNKAKNDALPQLDFSYTWQKSENNTPYIYPTSQGNYLLPNSTSTRQEIYGLTFSMPLYSTFTRDSVSAANAKAIESNLAALNESKNTSMLWEIDQKNVEINTNKVRLKLEIKNLNEKNLVAIQNQYRDGKVTNTEVQTSLDRLNSVEIDCIQSQADMLYSLLNSAYDSGSLLEVFFE